MSRRKQRLVGIAWFVFVLLLVCSMIAVAYYLTGYIFRLLGMTPSPLQTQIVNTLLGLLFTGLLLGVIGKLARSRGWIPEMNMFSPIIDALERISRGDFSVRVTNTFEDNEMVGKLASSVNKMALELDQMENLRQEFISNVSHEIQSPLTSIRGFAQALKNDNLTPQERHHYLGIIEEESTRLSRITEDLLRLASLDSEHLQFKPKQYRLDRQIRNLILACEPQWREKSIEMEVSLQEVTITADEDLLSQVWTNLLHNSIKFTPDHGSIQVVLEHSPDQAIFKISDTGVGIANEEQERIFERFYKADPSRTRSKEGSGLGLSIAKKIVELHRGTIEVESKVGTGTSFIVCLPDKQSHLDLS
jgi:two-component system, OmpR family, phosphate regulon sensor histidine kinase PhoR